MKTVFVGGGAQRLLGILRAALAKGIFDLGEIALVDRDLPRAEILGKLLKLTPEFQAHPCRVTWTSDLEAALEGADAVAVILMGGSLLSHQRASIPAWEHDYRSSDNVSLPGAFLALKTAPTLLEIAGKMEAICPDALLIDFANPIAPLSGMINRFTRIRAVGVCAGYVNHQWDLNRLLGRDKQSDQFSVKVAGVNHLSFILEGTMAAKDDETPCDLLTAIREALSPSWRPPVLQDFWPEASQKAIRAGLQLQADIFRDIGCLIFSTEYDGMLHLRYDELLAKEYAASTPPTEEGVRAFVARNTASRAEADKNFAAALSEAETPEFWSQQSPHSVFAAVPDDIFIRLLKGLSGDSREEVVCTTLNNGAIPDIPDQASMEFSQVMTQGNFQADGDLRIPGPVYGLIAGLAMHQMLLAEACTSEDPRLLAEALMAYPVRPYSNGLKQFCRDLVDINKDEIPVAFHQTKEFLTLR